MEAAHDRGTIPLRTIGTRDLARRLERQSTTPLDGGGTMVINSLEDPGYWEDCRIPGSVHIPISAIESGEALRDIEKAQPDSIIVHCANAS